MSDQAPVGRVPGTCWAARRHRAGNRRGAAQFSGSSSDSNGGPVDHRRDRSAARWSALLGSARLSQKRPA